MLQDNRVRVWRMDPETYEVSCVAVGDGHAKAVNTVAFSRLVVCGFHLFLDHPYKPEIRTVAFCNSPPTTQTSCISLLV